MSFLFRFACLFLLFCLTSHVSHAQLSTATADDERYTLHIGRTQTPIKLDGQLDEPVWKTAGMARSFFQFFPFDTSFAKLPTEVRVTFDANFLYVGVVVTQPRKSYITRSLKRDFDPGSSDVFGINIDPFKDKLNGFHFAVTPYGVQREGLIANGSDLTFDWDNKWYAEVQNFDDHWTAEIAIPFKTLRYRQVEGQNTWRINFTRNTLQQNETSSWRPVPRQFRPNTLAFTGLLVWDDAPPKPGPNVSLIPYTSARFTHDFEQQTPSTAGLQVGGDAKIAITPSLNLDLTINPDFSQVEVDKQQTNLSRFELSYPEKRQFFLENSDLFGTFGFPPSRPFFSRRIGIVSKTSQRITAEGDTLQYTNNVNVPILFGARLSGRLDKNWRVGFLTMQTGSVPNINSSGGSLAAANYTVGIIQRRIFGRSTIGAILVNKQNFMSDDQRNNSDSPASFNRVFGLEYNLYSKDNKWQGEAYYHRSISPKESTADAQTGAAFLGYTTNRWQITTGGIYIGKNYRAEVGYVPRRGYVGTFPSIQYTIYPKNPKISKVINNWGFGNENDIRFNLSEYRLTDRSNSIYVFASFQNQANGFVGLSNGYTYLFSPYDPTNTGGVELPAGNGYLSHSFFSQFGSNARRNLSGTTRLEVGIDYGGQYVTIQSKLTYRYQPYGVFAIDCNYTSIQLPKPYNSADLWLIGPRAELSFSRSVFFSTFLQYNTQANNFNINSRLQWRFRPVSDMFLVYTDNYFSEGLLHGPQPKNRALVLKVTYWLNV